MLFIISLSLGLILIGTIWYFVDRANRKATEKRQKQANEAAAMRRRQSRQTWDNPNPMPFSPNRSSLPASNWVGRQDSRPAVPNNDSGNNDFVLGLAAGYMANKGLSGSLTGGTVAETMNDGDDNRRPSVYVSEPIQDYNCTATDSGGGSSGGSD